MAALEATQLVVRREPVKPREAATMRADAWRAVVAESRKVGILVFLVEADLYQESIDKMRQAGMVGDEEVIETQTAELLYALATGESPVPVLLCKLVRVADLVSP